MAIGDSPFPRVSEVGPRILEIKNQLTLGAWDTGPLDTALKALRDDNGGIPLPNGYASTETQLQTAFETRPQIMEQSLTLFENEFTKFAVTVPAP